MTAPLLSRPVAIRPAVPIDEARIVAYVANHPDGTPFHLPAWGRAVADGCNQTDATLVAEGADGAIAGVLPLTRVASRLFGTALVSAGFAVGGGILADDAGAARDLANEAWRRATDLSAASLELRGGSAPGGEFRTDDATYLGFVRPLAADDSAELAAIPRKQRAEVRKALAGDFAISVGRAACDLADHYAVYSESVRNLGTPVFPRRLFATVLAAMDADILTVRHGSVPVASVLSLYWRGTVLPYWGGGTAAARPLRANDAMYFALMRHARERGCTRFDFGRSKAGTGAAAFKRNWGFEGRPLPYHVRTADGAARRAVNPLDPRYARKVAAWKRLPLPVANLIGPWLARGLG